MTRKRRVFELIWTAAMSAFIYLDESRHTFGSGFWSGVLAMIALYHATKLLEDWL